MKKYLFIISLLLLLPFTVNAASADIDLKATPTKASVGSTITVDVNINGSTAIGSYEYTLDYDHSKLELVEGKSYNFEHANSNNVKSFNKEFKFKVKANGASKISVKSYAVTNYSGNENLSVTVNPVSINSSGSSNQSDNNYLSNLEIEGYSLEPKFSKNTNNYILKIDDEIGSIKIKATPENNKASVIGAGERNLKVGDNRIEITVTSESGKDKTYTIKVTLSEQNPIKVTIDDKEYTVMRKIESYSDMKNYKLMKIKIDDQTVEALYNDKTGFTLILLKDTNGKTAFYKYDEGEKEYTKYYELKSDTLSVLPISADKKLKGYTLYKETIDDSLIECYKISSSSEFCAIYAINLADGEKDWYIYDITNNTLQRYNSDISDYYKEKMDSTVTLIYILSATTLLFGIMTISFAVKSGKKRR